jgi:hypothetical protein
MSCPASRGTKRFEKGQGICRGGNNLDVVMQSYGDLGGIAVGENEEAVRRETVPGLSQKAMALVLLLRETSMCDGLAPYD